jgi:hypothetical protein
VKVSGTVDDHPFQSEYAIPSTKLAGVTGSEKGVIIIFYLPTNVAAGVRRLA